MGMGDNGQIGTGHPFAISIRCSSHAIIMCSAERHNTMGGVVVVTPEQKRMFAHCAYLVLGTPGT
jgi:hypothetical protein